jgi:hypothetical protein
MKLWVDDLRPTPAGWAVARTLSEALAIYTEWHDTIDEVSLDHDLGGDETTRPLVLWMAEHDIWPDVVRVHTQNNVGREWLVGMVNHYGPGVTR